MNNIKKWFICMLIVTLQISIVGAAQVLKAVPEKVKFGTFNTFQIKETIVTLKNTGRETFLVDKIKADCSCIRTRLANKNIAPGQTVELQVAAMQRFGGKFSHNILIIPKDRERFEPVRIQATGNVVQPVSAKIGWTGKKPKVLDPNGPMRLGSVHKLSAKPVIYITAKDEQFNLRDSVPDVNSARFELHDYKFEKLPVTNPAKLGIKKKEHLVLTLKPKEVFKTGITKELISVKLTDDVKLDIRTIFQIVGDVYTSERMINLSTLSNSVSKELSIHFANDTKTWEDVKWNAKGYLSKAIVIKEDRNKRTDSCIRLTVSIDQSKLEDIPKGYLFCRVNFYQNEPTDDDVSVLIDGFN
ncbi:MAG: DUF1573 domain-containing protein [Planctomycetes bacterium]|nr:DUF1573 domain-containing protein [Planctomycetota bacterium]